MSACFKIRWHHKNSFRVFTAVLRLYNDTVCCGPQLACSALNHFLVTVFFHCIGFQSRCLFQSLALWVSREKMKQVTIFMPQGDGKWSNIACFFPGNLHAKFTHESSKYLASVLSRRSCCLVTCVFKIPDVEFVPDMLFNKDVTLVCQVLKAVGMRCGVFEYCLLSRKTYHILLVNNWNVAGVVLGQENLIYCWGRQPGSGTHVGSMAWKPGGEEASIRACLLLAIEQEFPFLRFWAAAKRGTGWML